VIVLGLLIVALVVILAALASRDEAGIRAVWNQINSDRRRFEMMARQAVEYDRAIISTHAAAEDARRDGDSARAARLSRAAATYEAETRDERRRCSLLRRMLSAIQSKAGDG